jgi:hypothetical protein
LPGEAKKMPRRGRPPKKPVDEPDS